MSVECIYNVDLTTNNNEVISIPSDNFNHFYIANIDDNGNEINYKKSKKNDILYANFFMIKIFCQNNLDININRLLNKKDIIKIGINFTSGKYQEFELPKKRILKNGTLSNIYETTYFIQDSVCIIVSDKAIKYSENLFI